MNSFERVIAVRKLDTEIEGMVTVLEEVNNALSHTICKVKRHRNSAAPVNGLLVELFSEIFLLTDDGKVQDKTAVSHVCSYWRNISLNLPSMWTKVNLASITEPQSISRRLCRNGSLPLCLEYYEWCKFSYTMAARCVHLLGRTDALKIRIFKDYIRISEGAWLIDHPAPALRRLELAVSNGPHLLPQLFGNTTPRSTELALLNCCLAWGSGLYVGLTKLKIVFHHMVPGPRQSGQDIRHVFQNCPNLEEIVLMHCGPVYDDVLSGVSGTVVHLSRMHTI